MGNPLPCFILYSLHIRSAVRFVFGILVAAHAKQYILLFPSDQTPKDVLFIAYS